MALGSSILFGCTTVPSDPTKFEPFAATEPVVEGVPKDIIFNVYDTIEFARLFTEIGGYDIVVGNNLEDVIPSKDLLTLVKDDHFPRLRLVRREATAPLARPLDAQSWDTGCYWSLMVRAKDLSSIVEDAEPLGWKPRTPIAYLEFGESKLHIVVLQHQKTGAQVQFYERLSTPLPKDYPDFDRFGVPFNIMQMASDRDETYEFFTEMLGFSSWYHGDPYVSDTEAVMPLGIPPELTTIVPYRASIVSPRPNMERGRFEMIEVMGEGHLPTARDLSGQCHAGAVGLVSVRYFTPHLQKAATSLKARGYAFDETEFETVIDDLRTQAFTVKSPDGAMIVISVLQ